VPTVALVNPRRDSDLIHTGQGVMALGGTVDYLVETVFNYPTLAESYKVVALDAGNKLQHLQRVTAEPGGPSPTRPARTGHAPALRP
jgi:hypothetical protein